MIDCACAILVRDDRILLGKRSPHRRAHPNAWDLIGGKCEPGETVEAALVRESQEEIDVTPTAFRSLGILTEPQADARGERTYHVYLITAWTGPGPRMCGDEHTEIRWVTIDEALAFDLALPSYRALFERLRREIDG